MSAQPNLTSCIFRVGLGEDLHPDRIRTCRRRALQSRPALRNWACAAAWGRGRGLWEEARWLDCSLKTCGFRAGGGSMDGRKWEWLENKREEEWVTLTNERRMETCSRSLWLQHKPIKDRKVTAHFYSSLVCVWMSECAGAPRVLAHRVGSLPALYAGVLFSSLVFHCFSDIHPAVRNALQLTALTHKHEVKKRHNDGGFYAQTFSGFNDRTDGKFKETFQMESNAFDREKQWW